MPILERNIEDRCVRFARAHGVAVYKMNGRGTRAWPDRLYFIPGGRVLLHEYKQLGKQPTPLQAENHAMLRKLGYEVQVIDTAEAGISSLAKALEAAQVSEKGGNVATGARARRAVPRPRLG